MTEFNLSDYIIDTPQGVKLVAVMNVKEFIKRLKEVCESKGERWVASEIDILAGEKLI